MKRFIIFPYPDGALYYHIIFFLSLTLSGIIPFTLSATPPSQPVQIPGVIAEIKGSNIVVQYQGTLRPQKGNEILVPNTFSVFKAQRVGIWKVIHAEGKFVEAEPINIYKAPAKGMEVVILTVSESDRKRVQTTTLFDPRFGFLLHSLSLFPKQPGLPENISGLYVYSVQGGSPAAKAGIKAGDILLAVNNIMLHRIHAYSFKGISESLPTGTPVQLRVWREGKETEFVTMLDK